MEKSYEQRTIRLPAALAAKLKNEYAQTYPEHRQSYNAWLVERLKREPGMDGAQVEGA